MRWSGTCARASRSSPCSPFASSGASSAATGRAFAPFVYAPSTSLRYLRGESLPHEHHQVGHNPLGAGSVFALLGILALQVAHRPDRRRRDRHHRAADQVRQLGDEQPGDGWHKNFGQWIIIAPGRAACRRDRLLLVPAPAEPGRADVAWRQAADRPTCRAAVDNGRSRTIALGVAPRLRARGGRRGPPRRMSAAGLTRR